MTVVVSKRMVRWLIIVAIASPVLIAGLNIWYTNRVDDRAKERAAVSRVEADRRWCALLSNLSNPVPAPTNDRSKTILRLMTELRASLGCPG